MGGGGSRPGEAQRALLLAVVALCSLLARPQPSCAFFFGGGRQEKVPMTVVVPDYSPRPAPLPLGPSPSAAPAPVPGSDGGGGDEDGTPRLPSERRSPGAPSSGDHHGAAAGAPAGTASADFISSSPAVPLPAGVTDSATVLPMPTPGQQQQLRDDVGMGALQLQVGAVQLATTLLMMLSFRALWCW
ncbi:hypothetical protein SETIT_7G096700v2 [Setaria italica]|nr:leucine-rich repeat extensin-like protein 5 [Setaria italica]RCV33619.1 hypothetical protein SETIT_7G096700v2 [Setaria italica]